MSTCVSQQISKGQHICGWFLERWMLLNKPKKKRQIMNNELLGNGTGQQPSWLGRRTSLGLRFSPLPPCLTNWNDVFRNLDICLCFAWTMDVDGFFVVVGPAILVWLLSLDDSSPLYLKVQVWPEAHIWRSVHGTRTEGEERGIDSCGNETFLSLGFFFLCKRQLDKVNRID